MTELTLIVITPFILFRFVPKIAEWWHESKFQKKLKYAQLGDSNSQFSVGIEYLSGNKLFSDGLDLWKHSKNERVDGILKFREGKRLLALAAAQNHPEAIQILNSLKMI